MREVDLDKKIKNGLIMWTIVSVATVVFIPVIPIAAVNAIWWLMAIAIAVVLFGVYGLPIGWTFTGLRIGHRKIVWAIRDDEILDIKELAHIFRRREKAMRKEIATVLSKRYIVGYRFNADRTKLVKPKKAVGVVPKSDPQLASQRGRCEFCGAPLVPGARYCKHCECAVV